MGVVAYFNFCGTIYREPSFLFGIDHKILRDLICYYLYGVWFWGYNIDMVGVSLYISELTNKIFFSKIYRISITWFIFWIYQYIVVLFWNFLNLHTCVLLLCLYYFVKYDFHIVFYYFIFCFCVFFFFNCFGFWPKNVLNFVPIRKTF